MKIKGMVINKRQISKVMTLPYEVRIKILIYMRALVREKIEIREEKERGKRR